MKLFILLSFSLGFAAILTGIENHTVSPIWLGVMFIGFGIMTALFSFLENYLYPFEDPDQHRFDNPFERVD